MRRIGSRLLAFTLALLVVVSTFSNDINALHIAASEQIELTEEVLDSSDVETEEIENLETENLDTIEEAVEETEVSEDLEESDDATILDSTEEVVDDEAVETETEETEVADDSAIEASDDATVENSAEVVEETTTADATTEDSTDDNVLEEANDDASNEESSEDTEVVDVEIDLDVLATEAEVDNSEVIDKTTKTAYMYILIPSEYQKGIPASSAAQSPRRFVPVTTDGNSGHDWPITAYKNINESDQDEYHNVYDPTGVLTAKYIVTDSETTQSTMAAITTYLQKTYDDSFDYSDVLFYTYKNANDSKGWHFDGYVKNVKVGIYYHSNFDNDEYYVTTTKTSKTHTVLSYENTELPTREGYEFLGWSKDQNATEPDVAIGSSEVVQDQIHYYAVWKQDNKDLTYTVNYYLNGVQDTEATEVVTESIAADAADTIETNPIKTYENYVLDKDGIKVTTDGATTTATEFPSSVKTDSVIDVYYVSATSQYTVNVYKQSTVFQKTVKDYTKVVGTTASADTFSSVSLSDVLAISDVKSAVDGLNGYTFNETASTLNATNKVEIKRDGTTVINLYYNLNTATIILDPNKENAAVSQHESNIDDETYYTGIGVDYSIDESTGIVTLVYSTSSTSFDLPSAYSMSAEWLGWKKDGGSTNSKSVRIDTSVLEDQTYRAQWTAASGTIAKYFLLKPGYDHDKNEITSENKFVSFPTSHFIQPYLGTSTFSSYIFENYKSYAEPADGSDTQLVDKELGKFVKNTNSNSVVKDSDTIIQTKDGKVYSTTLSDINWYVIKDEGDGWHVDGVATWTEIGQQLKVTNYTGVYDGKYHTIIVDADENAELSYEYSTDKVNWTASDDLPEYKNVSVTYVRVTATANDYTQSAIGTVTITKRPIIIESKSAKKIFDGKPLTRNNPDEDIKIDDDASTEDDGFVEGEGFSYDITGTITAVTDENRDPANENEGFVDNEFTYDTLEGTDVDNYEVTIIFGELRIINRGGSEKDKKYEIEVVGNSAEYQYDGVTKSVSGYTIETDPNATDSEEDEEYKVLGVVLGAALNADGSDSKTFEMNGVTYTAKGISAEASGLNAGSYDVVPDVSNAQIYLGDINVTDQFTIGAKNGTLTVKTRSVILTSATASKTYDGTPLTDDTITVSGDGFVSGEGATYIVTGSQTYEGSSANLFTYTLNSNTLASNYVITTVNGQLTVTDAPAVDPDDDPDDDPDEDPDDDLDDDPDTNGDPDNGGSTLNHSDDTPAQTGAVLGAKRLAATDSAAVLGARRAGTSDSTNVYRIYILMAAAIAAGVLIIFSRSKKNNK